MKYGMTNREKRAKLDEEFRRGYRTCTDEGVAASREEWLQRKQESLFHSRSLPLPENRGSWSKETLTLKTLEEQVRQGQKQADSIGMSVLLTILCLPVGLLLLWSGISVPSGFGMVMGLIFLLAAGLCIRSIPDTIGKNRRTLEQIRKGAFEIRGYRVVDMSHQDESSATDDNADWHYYLHLEKPGQKELWHYDCAWEDYRMIREEDTVWMVFPQGAAEPVYLYLEEFQIPDAQIRAYMRN